MAMDFRAIDFLGNFDEDSRKRIVEFGKCISSDALLADVYLVMARKAICFIDALNEFQLVNIRGKLVTDRILDMNTAWLNGKSVSIIDDALVSGTTLKKTIQGLEAAKVSSIKVFVLSINEKWFNPEMLTRDNGETYLVKPQYYDSNEKCLRMCYDIVKALSTVPKPYDIDYPLYGEFRIDSNQLNMVLNSSWSAFNVTSSSHISHSYTNKKNNPKNVISEFESITFLPPNSIVNELSTITGINFTNSCVFKVRSYIRKRTRKAAEYNISFLPFAIFNEIYESDLDRIIQHIFTAEIERTVLNFELKTSESKLRVVQFYVAAQLMKIFFQDVGIFDTDSILQPNLSRISYIFTSPVVEILRGSIRKHQELMATLEIHSSCSFVESPDLSLSNGLNYNCVSLFNSLSHKFYDLYLNRELKARKLAKDLGKSVFEPAEYQELMKRLEIGYSFHDLCLLSDNRVIAKEYVSLFLDYAIDTGIAVPIIYRNDGKIFRAYRHGEDVIFTTVEEELLAYMLSTFLQSSKRKDIPALLLEKLLTTFIRFGLHDGIFEKYDYKRIHNQTYDYIKIAYNLHGSVARVIKPDMINSSKAIITTDTQSLWLRDVLINNKLLSEVPGRVRGRPSYYIEDEVRDRLIDKHKFSEHGLIAKRISNVIGYLYSEKVINETDLILLNASFGHDQIIPSLLAEVAIIRERFSIFSHFLLSRYNDSHVMNWIVAFRNDIFFIAQNSGFMKLTSYYNDVPRKIIQRIHDCNKGDMTTEYFYDEFERYWNYKTENMKEEVPNDIERIIKEASLFLLQYGLVYRIIEYMIFQKHIGARGIKDYFSVLRTKIIEDESKVDDSALVTGESTSQDKNKCIIAYLRLCHISLSSIDIKDDDIIDKLASGNIIKTDIAKYISWITRIDNASNIYKSKSLVEMANHSLQNFEAIPLDRYINHLEFINERARRTIDIGCKYINFHGEIEKPISFSNAIIVKTLHANDHHMHNCLFTHIESEVKEKQSNIRKNSGVELQYQVFDDTFVIMSRGPRSDEALLNFACWIEITLNQSRVLEIYTIVDINRQYAPYRFESCCAAINVSSFLTYFYELKCMLPAQKSHFIMLSEAEHMPQFSYTNDFLKSLNEVILPSGSLPSQTARDYYLYYLKEGESISMKTGFTIGVICAKKNELSGIINAIQDCFGVSMSSKFDAKENNRLIDLGKIVINGMTHTIIVIKCNQGNDSAANAYASLAHYNPDYVIFVGIAGACNNKIKLGDVILPKVIFDSTLKKETNEEFQLRGNTYQIPGDHIGVVDLFMRTIEDMNLPFSLHDIPLASDNTVYACDNSKILRSIFKFNNNVGAVEMESAGIYKADYERHKTKHGVFTIRGISDNADTVKDDSYHRLAISNASLILCEFLKHLSLHEDEINAL